MIAILVFNKMGKYIYLSIYLGREHDCHFGFNKMGKSVYLSIKFGQEEYQIWTRRTILQSMLAFLHFETSNLPKFSTSKWYI